MCIFFMSNTHFKRFFAFFALLSSVCAGYGFAETPDFQDVERAILAVRAWIQDDLQIPEDSAYSLPNETSVCVVLRHHGQLLGVGVAHGQEKDPLKTAATTAFVEANRDKAFAKLSPAFKTIASSSISIEVELGGKPIPSPSKNYARFSHKIRKGIDGIGARRQNTWDIRLPASMRLSPRRKITSVLASICLNVGVHPAVAISGELPENEDITLYTIPTVTGYQTEMGAQVTLLVRGDELVTSEPPLETITSLSHILAKHLIVCTSESGVVIGGYQPETDSFSSPIASPFVQIMVANALEEYASLQTSTFREDARSTASNIISDVEKKFYDHDVIPIEVAASTVLLLASSPAPWSNETVQFMHACRETVMRVSQNIVQNQSLSEPSHVCAILALSISEIATNSSNPKVQKLAEDLCLLCIEGIPLESKISTIPWLFDAVELLNANGSKLATESMDELLSIALASQSTLTEEIDLDGGFFVTSKEGLVADARGLRMIPMLAKSTSPLAEQALLKALRFATQLTTREPRANRFQTPSFALGGVRASLWDATMPTEATAMTLLGVVRAIESIESRTPSE